MRDQRIRKGIATRETRETREVFEPVSIEWQCVGLLISDHLQAIFNRAQEAISGAEIITHMLADPSPIGEHVERPQGLFGAQFGMPAAGNELLGLHEEFDLPDAAPAELDIVPLDGNLVVTAIGVDLSLHGVNVSHGREVYGQ